MAWLDSLKPGDKVALYRRGLDGDSYRIATIEHITAKRTFRLAGSDICYNAHGHRKGKSDRWSFSEARLEPVTQEVLDTNERLALRYKLQEAASRDKIGALSLDSLRKIAALLSQDKGD